MRHAFACAVAAMLVLTGAAWAAEAPEVAGVRLKVEGQFAFGLKPKDEARTRQSLSAIACPPPGMAPRRCVVAFDEGVAARTMLLEPGRAVAEPDPVPLLAGGKEADAEAAARIGSIVYVAGSHSVKRKSCEPNSDARHVFRFEVDDQGRPKLPAGAAAANDGGRLWDFMARHETLGRFAAADACLGSLPLGNGRTGRHGLNIEGLAAHGPSLFFGFREPAIDGTAYILRVNAAALFTPGASLDARLLSLPAGPRAGIRDLLAVPDGILLLIGPDDDSAGAVGWKVSFWDGRQPAGGMIAIRDLARLKPPGKGACDAEVKPEAMALLEDGPGFRSLLILSDGMCDGGPHVYRIPK